MDFEFSAEQYALRDLARDVVEKVSPPSRLRELWDGAGRGEDAWRTLAEVGLLGVIVPEEHGGAGGDLLDLALVLEEAGCAALPEPLLETVAVAVPLLVEGGNDEQCQQWLPRIAAGEAIVTVQLGGAPFAVDGDIADLLILDAGDELHAVPRASYEAVQVATEDRARRLFEVTATTGAHTLMPGGRDVDRRAGEVASVATASVLNGVSSKLLALSIDYASTRHQFGRPIGSFQAVKHELATLHLAVESARAATWYGAYALARDLDDRTEAASVAKAAASDAAARVNRGALQVHGGIGFTWEHDLHLWLKRGLALQAAYGDAAAHRAVAADLLRARSADDGER